MIFGSVCSGIEAASVAWEPIGWKASWLAEIEPFPSALLAHHYPSTPNLGDMTKIAARILAGEIEAPDVLVGGTPCQAFSVAGLRNSLNDERGQLSLAFIHLADSIDAVRRVSGQPAAIITWENVPGVLSTNDNAFGCFLAGLVGEDSELRPTGKRWSDAGCVYGPKRTVAWRILDAQHFGLAQRRRRVFVVASARDGFDPASVLFEREGVRRDSPPSRESGETVTPTIRAGASNGGAGHGDSKDELIVPIASSTGSISHCLNAGSMRRTDYESETMIVHGTQDPCTSNHTAFALGRNNGGENAVTVSLRGREGGATAELGDEIGNCLRASGGGGDKAHVLAPAIGWSEELTASVELDGTIQRGGDGGRHDGVMMPTMQVRRLTPRECERLQGFPDDYTLINVRGKPAADGPRYKALGNSMAVPVMAWIGRRIAMEARAAA